MGRNADAASASRAGEVLGDHQIDGDPVGRHPGTGLLTDRIEDEACAGHRLLEKRILNKFSGVDGEVGVFGGIGQGEGGVARAQVDRLGTDEDHRCLVGFESCDRVEQSRASFNDQIAGARRPGSPSSSPTGNRPQQGFGRGRQGGRQRPGWVQRW